MLITSSERLRSIFVISSSIIITIATLALAFLRFPSDKVYFQIDYPIISYLMLSIEVLIGAFICYIGIKRKQYTVITLLLIQLISMIVFEIIFGHTLHNISTIGTLFIDKFSIIMALIIGIIGTLICVYALGYMKYFHKNFHPETIDNRKSFFAILWIFLSSMFGIVFSNNLLWFYFFWEITTLCSFLLIQYKGNDESINNSFLALRMNLIGGLAFAIAIIFAFTKYNVIELDGIINIGVYNLVLIPTALLAIAGLTKSAQLPFSKWLLGAMVAPSPVSALLHSSTMVKAGVYLLVRLAPVFENRTLGLVIAILGGVTFLASSCIAISQSNAKKVLAYSTIANLGLIVMCAGVGTYEAIWAAILLIIFHAVAKCLLFLIAGLVEHKIHSKDIEDMSGLIMRMPKISIMMQIGIAGMFLAPFGMLISKWAVLKALIDANPLLSIFIVFGSSVTLFFWVKWMGKLLEVTRVYENIEKGISATEMIPLYILSFLTIGVCTLFPLMSSYFIEPYVIEIYGITTSMSQGNFIIMLTMLGLLALFPLSFFFYGRKVKVMDSYLGGANVESSIQFYGSAGKIQNVNLKNYYLDKYFGEHLLRWAIILGCILSVLAIAVAI
jgi:ech hydrogenase subunit A